MKIVFSLAMALGVIICLLKFTPNYYRSPLRILSARRDTIVERFQKALQTAGLFSEAPTFIVVTGALSAGVIGLVLATLFSNLIFFVFGPLIVLMVGYYYLGRKQRKLVNTSGDTLVPFIRSIESAVRVGTPLPTAYKQAVIESPPGLRSRLDESLAEMATGVPFIDALLHTQERIPLRMWRVLVRQLEIHDRAGGDLPKSMAATVKHIDAMISLQKLGQAQYIVFAVQQKIAFVLGVVIIFVIGSRLSPNQWSELATNPLGLVGFMMGVIVISVGVFITRQALKAVRERINF